MLTTAIDNHRAAYKCFRDALDITAKKLHPPEMGEEAVEAPGNVEIDAFYDLCAHPCTPMEEVRQKAEYLLGTALI